MKDKSKETIEMTEPEICGIVMPISEREGRTEQHWKEVRAILESAIEAAGLKPELVSDSENFQVIHKSIIHNLHNNPIVVCAISATNPNVMFELGFRVGVVGKPVILVKDSETKFEFDTQVIRTLLYSRSLRHPEIEDFKARLAGRIRETVKLVREEKFISFLDNFSPIKAPEVATQPITDSERKMDSLADEIRSLRKLAESRSSSPQVTVISSGTNLPPGEDSYGITFPQGTLTSSDIDLIREKFSPTQISASEKTIHFDFGRALWGPTVRQNLATILGTEKLKHMELFPF